MRGVRPSGLCSHQVALIDADFFREVFIAYVGDYAEHRELRRNPVEVITKVTVVSRPEPLPAPPPPLPLGFTSVASEVAG